MWTNKNTPLILAIGVAMMSIAVGALLNTPVTVISSIVLAALILTLGVISRRMTHLWLTDDVRLWERHIRQFERADQKQMPSPDAIVFVGSSTIRFWKTLTKDMSPLPIIQRGFGGSRILDAIYYANRIVIPYQPAAIIVYSGTNDIAGKTSKSATYVAEKFKEFFETVHKALPDVPIYYIAIIPTPARKNHWSTVREANDLIKTYTTTDKRLHYIDTTAEFLDEDGQPKRELYRWDRIHLSTAGYTILTNAVKPVLINDLSARLLSLQGS